MLNVRYPILLFFAEIYNKNVARVAAVVQQESYVFWESDRRIPLEMYIEDLGSCNKHRGENFNLMLPRTFFETTVTVADRRKEF